MAWIDKKVAAGFAAGFGAGLAAPHIMPVLAEAARPLIKAGVRSAALTFERAREASAHIREAVEDGLSEAQAELAGRKEAAPEPAAEGPAPGGAGPAVVAKGQA